MSLQNLFNTWPNMTPINFLILIMVIICLLYLSKEPAHRAILSLCHTLRNGLRMIARSLLLAEKRVTQRNREVLFSAGQSSLEKTIEREFQRVNTIVGRDLSGFPVLKRALFDQVNRIDEDYHQSSELAPPLPKWIGAVEAVAKIKDSGNSDSVADILSEIHESTQNQFKSSMESYRKAVGDHHLALNKILPHLREVNHTLNEVDKTMTGLHDRSAHIDKCMQEYEDIVAKTDKAERMLTSSAITQFFISGLVLLIAIGGAVINFNLIALPMSEMVGGGSYIAGFKTSNVAALIIILVEVAMGLYLMESLRITHLFPIIGQMDDKMRVKMIWITFSLLLVLAGIESSLALMRDQIAMNNQALLQTLSGGDAVLPPTYNWIPMVGQMIMGFILPFVLTFVAIPLESFIHATRTVMGVVLALLLRFTAFTLRLFGNIIFNTGDLLVNVYDIIIFAPLWIESVFKNGSSTKKHVEDIPHATALSVHSSKDTILAKEVIK